MLLFSHPHNSSVDVKGTKKQGHSLHLDEKELSTGQRKAVRMLREGVREGVREGEC